MNLIAEAERLRSGETVTFKTVGGSMVGKVSPGAVVTVEPVVDQVLKKGDIVLCKVNGHHYLHLITGTRQGTYQISNNKGHVNGWTPRKNIFGLMTDRG